MAETEHTLDLADAVAQALVGDVEPERLEGYGFARRLLAVFGLVRSLFSTNELDTCLKLMLLYELARAGGRVPIEGIRVRARFLDPERVDALVRSLRDGGWLALRAADHTYRVSTEGLNLLAVLQAASLDTLTPANALARAAQSAEFGARLDGARDATGYLLDQLLGLLEEQVEEARLVVQRGRPFRMIAWSRRQHGHQLEVIRQVLTGLQSHMDASSRELARIVRLHEQMQEIVRLHEGINTRLRDWNLERLHTSDAGYSIPELCEAVLGVDDAAFAGLLTADVVQAPALAPSLTTDELQARFHALRRTLPSQRETFAYAPLAAPALAPWTPADLDPAAALRARLTAALAGRGPEDPPLELEDWLAAGGFAGVSYELATLARLEEDGARLRLEDGRGALLRTAPGRFADVAPAALLAALTAEGALRGLPAGHFTRVRLAIAPGTGQAAPDVAPEAEAGEGADG